MEQQKRRAALRSLEFVNSGMLVGLGTGSTAAIMIELLAERVRGGLAVRGVPTSESSRQLAVRHGVPLAEMRNVTRLDLTIDGADELDAELRLIKGGGGALLREKVVASLSDKLIVIADSSKIVDRLGAFPLPVAVLPFAASALLPVLGSLGCRPVIRTDAQGTPFSTDDGHNIVDCAFGAIADPEALARALDSIPGVVGHGLFLGMADRVLIGADTGVDEMIREHT